MTESSSQLASNTSAANGPATATANSTVNSTGATTLDIQLGSAASEGSTANSTDFGWADLKWKAELGTAAASVTDPTINSYSLTQPDGTTPADSSNYFSGVVFQDPTDSAIDAPDMDTLTQSAATEQLNSNLATLSTALGSGAVTSSSASVVPVGDSSNSFALSATINVGSASVLDGHLGDIVDGLQTGLLGGDQSAIEGLAIEVFADGTPEVGAWAAARAGSGELQFGTDLNVPDVLTTTTQFPVLGNGPATDASAVGAPAQEPSPVAGDTTTAAPSPAPDWWLWSILAVVSAAALAIAGRRVVRRTPPSGPASGAGSVRA